MKTKACFLSLIILVASALPAAAQKGGVAILDIDEVARKLGVEEKVRVDLLNIQNNLNTELQRTQETMQKQMTGVEQAAGENPSDEDKRRILATNQQLNEEFNRIRAQAQNTLAQERVRMINEFRIRLEPIALKAAEQAGLQVVLMKVTPPVFTYDNSVDITQATIKLALEAGMQVKASELAPPATTQAPESLSSEAPAVTPAGDGKSKGGANEAKSKGKEKGQ